MPALRIYRLFISHAWDDGGDYRRLIDLLDEANNFEYMNYSVPKEKAKETRTDKELKEALKAQMDPVQIMLVIAGMYIPYRYWIQYEMDLAQSYSPPKPIIGIKRRGSERVPQAVQDAACEIVGWSTSSIVSAIRRHA